MVALATKLSQLISDISKRIFITGRMLDAASRNEPLFILYFLFIIFLGGGVCCYFFKCISSNCEVAGH